MSPLASVEYEGLLELAQAALQAETAMAWWEVYADLALGPLLHADVVAITYIHHGPDVTASFGAVKPAWAEAAVPSGSPMHRDLLEHHPLTKHLTGRHARDIVRISDLLPPRVWANMAAHSKMVELIGATNQLNITVAASKSRRVSTSPIRAHPDFTDHEVDVARRIEPLLRAADSHTRALAHYRARQTADERAFADGAATSVKLTNRERVVLGLIGDGYTATAIGRRLAVAPRTISKHQEHIYRKLGVNDRLSAVLVARRIGLLSERPASPRRG